MTSELSNNIIQTDIMEAQLEQDFNLAYAKMTHQKNLQDQNEKVLRELNNKIVDVLAAIEKQLGNISEKLDKIGDHIRIEL